MRWGLIVRYGGGRGIRTLGTIFANPAFARLAECRSQFVCIFVCIWFCLSIQLLGNGCTSLKSLFSRKVRITRCTGSIFVTEVTWLWCPSLSHPGEIKKRSNDEGHASESSQFLCALINCTRIWEYCWEKQIHYWKLVWDFLSTTSRF